jgi:biopolymer transport protein ExbD
MFKPTLKKKTSINIIPMIDVIFFLLVFFMLFTSFQSTPQGLNMQLPRAVTATEQKSQNVVINIDQSGNIFYQGEKLPIGQVIEMLNKKSNNTQELTAIINADKDTRYKHVINVMDRLRKAGIYKLALAAEAKGENDEI